MKITKIIAVVLSVVMLFGLCSAGITGKIVYAEELEAEIVTEKESSDPYLVEESKEQVVPEHQEESELQMEQDTLENEETIDDLQTGEKRESFEEDFGDSVEFQSDRMESNVDFQETFSLPTKESEKWISFNVEKPGSSVSIKVESEQEELDAPISMGILSPDSKTDTDWYWEVGISNCSASAFSELKEVTCYFNGAGRYRLMICNASHLNNLYFKEENLTSFTVSGKIYEGDAYELNNCEEQATELKSGEKLTCTLNGQGDEDYFIMEVTDVSIPLQLIIMPGEENENGKFDSPICYSLYRIGEKKEIITSTMENYAAGAKDKLIKKNLELKDTGIYYLKLANASYINPLYYGHYDNKTPFLVQCDYIGKDNLLELSEEAGDEITDLELFMKYPQYLNNTYVSNIESYINEHLNEASKDVKGGVFGTAYKKSLDSGGMSIMLNELLSSVGLAKSEYEKCRDEVAKEYILEICGKEDYIKKIASGTSKKLKDLKDISGFFGEVTLTKTDIVRLANAFNVKPLYIKNLTDDMKKEWKSLSKDFKQAGKVIEYGEFLLEVLYIDALEKDILEDLQSRIPMHYDLWWALDEYSRAYNEKIKEDIYYKLVKEPMNELISIIDEKLINSLFDMAIGGTPSPGVIQAAKLATKMVSRLIPAASVSDTVAAITRHSYTDSIRSGIINNMITEFIKDSYENVSEKVTEQKMNEYERYYGLYLSLIGSDIDAIQKMTGENGLMMLSFAEDMLNKYSYRTYINLCKRAVLEREKTGLKYKKVGEYVVISGRTEGLSKEQKDILLIPSTVQEMEVQVIGERAFENCKEINTLYIEEGTKTIKADAFKGCTNLKTVYFPKSLKTIESGAFSGCIKLENIEFHGDINVIGENVFKSTGLQCMEGKSDYLKKYAEENGFLYVEKSKKATALSVIQKPTKLQYNVTDEKIDLSGLVLKVWYEDNTNEIIEDLSNVLAVFHNRFVSDSYVDLYYDDAECWYDVGIEQIETECEIRYVDQYNNQIDEFVTVTSETGRNVSEIDIDSLRKEIEGYEFIDIEFKVLNQILDVSNNIIKLVYAPNTYEVEFDANGGTGEDMPKQKYTYDVPQELLKNVYTYDGYIFNGWNTDYDGTGIKFSDQQEVNNLTAIPDDTVVLYAQWKHDERKYTIRYDKNGATDGMMQDNLSCQFGVTYRLRANTFVKKGYVFAGWSTTPNGAVVYKDREKVRNLASSDGEIKILYAQWVPESGNSADTDTVNKSEKTVKISKITLSGISKNIAAGKKIKLTAEVKPSNAKNKAVTWKSSNTKVATVNSKGVVTLKKNSGGKKVTITATAKDGSKKKATYKITSMKGVVKKVAISGKKTRTLKAGKTLKLKAKVTAANSRKANKTLKWTSSNMKYATVSSDGKVKTKKAGKGKKVKITAAATDGSGKKQTVTLKIR